MVDTTTLAGLVLGLASAFAVGLSVFTYFRTARTEAYADMDELYLEILKLGMVYPRFRDVDLTRDYVREFTAPEERVRYDTYAYISWNICETIFDRREEAIFATWLPALIEENRLHRRWFDDPANHHKFKESFRKYVRDTLPSDGTVRVLPNQTS